MLPEGLELFHYGLNGSDDIFLHVVNSPLVDTSFLICVPNPDYEMRQWFHRKFIIYHKEIL